MKFKQSFKYTFALLFSVTSLFAQSVVGTVSDSDGNALAGANVSVEGTDLGASSNQDGSFSISGLGDGTYTVTATYIGFEDASSSVTVSGGASSSVNLTLDKGNLVLDQVVVSASLKRELVTEAPASVEVISGDDLTARNAVYIVDILANKAGIETMKTGLESQNMTVRGFNGIFTGAVHAVVDNRWTRAPVINAQLLQFMAPGDDDIERVEVLRGPAPPMYGPDTQQGVISMFTKSPFNQGPRVEVTAGERNYLKLYGRYAGQLGSRAATRLTVTHTTFDDWASNMPRTQAEAALDGHTYFEPLLIRRGEQTVTYPYVDYTRGGYNDPVGGSPNTASADEPFSPEATFFDSKTVFRPDLKSNLTVNLRAGNISALELTGIGRAHSDDAWLYQMQVSYFRQDILGGNLFVNLFSNVNDQKTTYNLSTGNIIYDQSKNTAFQIQHALELKNDQSLLVGLDVLSRTPETNGTINGKNEDIDNFDNTGVYYSYEKKFSDEFKVVATGRYDTNNYLEDIGTDGVFAPKFGMVWSPDDVRGSFRLTYGQNIDLPGNFTKNLDIAVRRDFVYGGVFGIDFTSATNPTGVVLPFNPDFQIKAMGSTTTGWTYDRDANGTPTFRSNWSTALGLDTNTNYAMNNSTINAAAFGVWAPITAGLFLASDNGAALVGGYGQAVGAAYAAATGDVAGAAAYGAAQATAAAQALLGLAATAMPSSFGNVALDLGFNVVDPNTTFPDIPKIQETTWTQTEFGYNGLVSDNMALSVDVYKLNVDNYVTGLKTSLSGAVTVAGDAQSYVAALMTGMAGDANLTGLINVMDAPALGGNGNGTGADELAAQMLLGVGQVPIGAITPEQNIYGGNLIMGYKQLTEPLDLHGIEATLNYFPSQDWNFFINGSYLSDEEVTSMFEGVEETVYMNTPQFKLGAGFSHTNDNVSYGANLRYQDSFFAEGWQDNSGEIPGFYTIGVNANWNVKSVDGLSVGLNIDNLTDVVHREGFLAPLMGRFSSLSVGYDL